MYRGDIVIVRCLRDELFIRFFAAKGGLGVLVGGYRVRDEIAACSGLSALFCHRAYI